MSTAIDAAMSAIAVALILLGMALGMTPEDE